MHSFYEHFTMNMILFIILSGHVYILTLFHNCYTDLKDMIFVRKIHSIYFLHLKIITQLFIKLNDSIVETILILSSQLDLYIFPLRI